MRRVYGIGGTTPSQRNRYFITIPSAWLTAIEKKHGRHLETLSFKGYEDRAVLRPMWGDVVAEKGSKSFVKVLDFKTHKKIQLPLSWLLHIGFNPQVHGRKKPRPIAFKILMQTTDDNELVLMKLKGEATVVQEP